MESRYSEQVKVSKKSMQKNGFYTKLITLWYKDLNMLQKHLIFRHEKDIPPFFLPPVIACGGSAEIRFLGRPRQGDRSLSLHNSKICSISAGIGSIGASIGESGRCCGDEEWG
jgi:hypothetical protein